MGYREGRSVADVAYCVVYMGNCGFVGDSSNLYISDDPGGIFQSCPVMCASRPEFLTALLQNRCIVLSVLPFPLRRQEASRVVSLAAFTSTKTMVSLPRCKALCKNLTLKNS